MRNLRRFFAAGATALALLAPTGAAKAGDVLETVAADGKFTMLMQAIEAAGLADILKGKGPITVFAPPDSAFAALPIDKAMTMMSPANLAQLVAIIRYHVVGRKLTSDMLPHREIPVKPLNEMFRLKVFTDGKKVTVDGANVVSADIAASNGFIHVIDKVLIPKPPEDDDWPEAKK